MKDSGLPGIFGQSRALLRSTRNYDGGSLEKVVSCAGFNGAEACLRGVARRGKGPRLVRFISQRHDEVPIGEASIVVAVRNSNRAGGTIADPDRVYR